MTEFGRQPGNTYLNPFIVGYEPGDTDPVQLAVHVGEYQRDRLTFMPGLLRADQADTLLGTTLDVPATRVICGDPCVSWDEQSFDIGHPARQFFELPTVTKLAYTLAGQERHSGIRVWTSVYREGEYINSHRDRAGSLHLLVCLKAPMSSRSGGVLIAGGRELFMNPGDAVAFVATEVEHQTTPLVATDEDQDPIRKILVGRYYF